MITTERLEEIRANQQTFIKQPALPPRVKFLAEEIEDALGELLDRRQIEKEQPTCIPLFRSAPDHLNRENFAVLSGIEDAKFARETTQHYENVEGRV